MSTIRNYEKLQKKKNLVEFLLKHFKAPWFSFTTFMLSIKQSREKDVIHREPGQESLNQY